jgi:hypothetical protein
VIRCSASPFVVAIRNALTNPKPSRCTTVPVAAMSHALIATLPGQEPRERVVGRGHVARAGFMHPAQTRTPRGATVNQNQLRNC